MNKKLVLIIIIGVIVLAAGITIWFILHPMQKVQTESVPAHTDAWKLERTQGHWASDDAEYELDIDGYDYTLKVNGVYVMVASLQFVASEGLQEDDARFTMQTDPSSIICPDAEGTAYYEIDSLYYEDGIISLFLKAAGIDTPTHVCLVKDETP